MRALVLSMIIVSAGARADDLYPVAGHAEGRACAGSVTLRESPTGQVTAGVVLSAEHGTTYLLGEGRREGPRAIVDLRHTPGITRVVASLGAFEAPGLRLEFVGYRSVTLRWRPPRDLSTSTTLRPRAAEGGAWALREMGLFLLDGGARVGVGAIVDESVELTAFAEAYAADPAAGYVRRRVRVGDAIRIADRSYVVRALRPRGAERGTVELAPG